jgi:palmitoyl-protein thioesterase
MKIISICLLFTLIGLSFQGYPIAVFHGLGDFCLNPGMINITNHLGKGSDSYAKCIESGGSALDFMTSFNTQAKKACDHLKGNENFAGKDISVVGLSQGSLIARYIIEECDFGGSVKRYVSIGGPQMGVAVIPHCSDGWFCNIINGITDKVVYTSAIQSIVGPAGYFHTYNDEKAFREGSSFLAELNNEKETANSESYKNRFIGLESMVLIMFTQDTMIIPKETAHFQFYNDKKEVVAFTETDVYQEDKLGLRTLHEAKKIQFFGIDGNHLQFTMDDIDTKMVPYLK